MNHPMTKDQLEEVWEEQDHMDAKVSLSCGFFLTKLFFNHLSPFCKSITNTARSLSVCLSLTLSPFPPNPLLTYIVPFCFSISLPLSLLQGSRVGTGGEANSQNVLIVGLGSQNVFQHARSGRQRPVGRE